MTTFEPEIDLSANSACPISNNNNNGGGGGADAVAVSLAMPVPVQPSFRTQNVMTETALEQLQSQGYPRGLAQELGNTVATYPLRFWIVDNSGSMRTSDGHELRGGGGGGPSQGNIMVVPCTRWTELQGAVEYHAELAGLISACTVFRFLNDPGATVGPQECSVADPSSTTPIDRDVSNTIAVVRKAEPAGVTPLTFHLTVIRSRIEAVESVLRAQGQKAVVVIATDGLPSDDSGRSNQQVKDQFVQSLRELQKLPVWVVIRLCTDDDTVVDYYNDLDRILELPLEVIDDFLGEAAEIHQANRWLNYALPLHRCREMGYQHRIFDLLDERLLNKDELREFLTLLFGDSALRNAPDIHANWKGFCSVLENVVKAEAQEWNPHTKKRGPWIDMKQLKKLYAPKRGLFGFGKK